MHRSILALVGVCVLSALIAAPANGTYPGKNGRIAFVDGGDIWTVNPDGSGTTPLTTDPAADVAPAWSPSGQQIAFASNRSGQYGLWVMNSDGSGQTPLPTGPQSQPPQATWSPDGTKIAFGEGNRVWTIDPDGTDLTMLPLEFTCGPEDDFYEPAWSPDGTELVVATLTYSGCTDHEWFLTCIHRIVDGERLTCIERPSGELEPPHDWSPDNSRVVFSGGSVDRHLNESSYEEGPVGDVHWSPDGQKVVAANFVESITVMNHDGTESVVVGGGSEPDWQPIPVNAYPRPRAATPMELSLVPAYNPCIAPNRQHGPPLAFGSCNPPAKASDEATVGTPDSNGRPAKGQGFVRFHAIGSNVQVTFEASDVYDHSTLADYTGELRLRTVVRITDKRNTPHPGGPGAGTVSDTTFGATVTCAATADTTVGSSCSLSTTANALAPGTVTSGARTIWELGEAQVDDGGADGDADTVGDNTVFMRPGLFVP